MCGIIAYSGKNNALPILLDGLRRLEYRGYDSSGVAVCSARNVCCIKETGKVLYLTKKITNFQINGRMGIAHTRWATHGRPSVINAHPHFDCQKNIYLAHNGIIENYQELKSDLIKNKHIFRSETDSEVIAHLLEEVYDGDITEALKMVLKKIKGAYGLVVFHKNEPNKLLAARRGSPLVIGLGENETIVASDVAAIIKHTKQVIYLNDGEIAEIVKGETKIFSADFTPIQSKTTTIDWTEKQAEKNGFNDFMLKEIYEQPQSITATCRGRLTAKAGKVKLGGLDDVEKKLHNIKNLTAVACGTAWHAGLVGKYMIEEYAGLLVGVEYASEFRYRKSIINKQGVFLAISQSGETADTLAAVREAKLKGALTLGIVNNVGSTIARETDAGIYNHIGPEIAVASSKAFTSQLIILAMLTIKLGRMRQMSATTGERIIKELKLIPVKVKKVLEQRAKIERLAIGLAKSQNMIFLGRKYNFPIALEAALKVKELSYIHAEGIPSGEMKHGHIALVDKNLPCVFLAPEDSVYQKNISNMEEIKSRGGKIIVITTAGNKKIETITDSIIYIPKTLEMLTPILTVIPMQLLAYYLAKYRGCNIDKPRNLAKSVTVE